MQHWQISGAVNVLSSHSHLWLLAAHMAQLGWETYQEVLVLMSRVHTSSLLPEAVKFDRGHSGVSAT